MKIYWTVSDGFLLKSDTPVRFEFEGLELESLDHASSRRLAKEIVSRPRDSQFALVKNDFGIAAIWGYHGDGGAKFIINGEPSDCDDKVLLPACQMVDDHEEIHIGDLSFPVGTRGAVWFLFAVNGGDDGIAGARQRLDENLRSVFG